MKSPNPVLATLLLISLTLEVSLCKNKFYEAKIDKISTSTRYPTHDVKNALMCQYFMDHLPHHLKNTQEYKAILCDKDFHFMSPS